MQTNEIRDFLERAPKRSHFDGLRMVYNTSRRYKWLAEISNGLIDERINRRAGIDFSWMYAPWKPSRAFKAMQRNARRQYIVRCGRSKKCS